MKTIKEQIQDELNYDPLQEAENLTGKDSATDEGTVALGMFNNILHSNRMNNLMDCTDDTKFSETEGEYMRKVTEFGFKEVLTIPFKNTDNIEERLHIMFHYDYSILLVWDTFTYGDDGSWAKAGKSVPPPSRNGGNFYYNWSPNDLYNHGREISSGGFVFHSREAYGYLFNKEDLTPHPLPSDLIEKEPKCSSLEWKDYRIKSREWTEECKDYFKDKNLMSVWSGNHDCREALKYHIRQLSEKGSFLKKWKEKPFLWLLHHGDTKVERYDYKAINQERIAMLPEDIQEIIKGENNN